MMRAIFNRSEFVKALELIGGVVPKRSPKPVLQCVRLEAKDNKVRLAGTDLETAILVDFYRVQIEHEGVALIDLAELLTTLRASTAEIVKLEPREGEQGLMWRVADTDSEFTITAGKPEEFPPLPISSDAPPAGSFTVNRDHLTKGIGYVAWSAGDGASRYSFDSLCFSIRRGRVQLVTTDSRTLAIADLGGIGEAHFAIKAADGEGDFAIPDRIGKLLTAASKYSAGDADDCSATFSLEHFETEQRKYDSLTARFTIGTVTVLCVVGDIEQRRFPPFRDILSGFEDRNLLSAPSAEFLTAVKKCAVAANQGSPAIALELDGKFGARLSAANYEGRTARVNFPCRVISGGIRFGLNPIQLTAAIKAGKSDEFTLAGSAPNRPWMIRNGNGYRALLMPLPVSDKPAPVPQAAAPQPEPVASAA